MPKVSPSFITLPRSMRYGPNATIRAMFSPAVDAIRRRADGRVAHAPILHAKAIELASILRNELGHLEPCLQKRRVGKGAHARERVTVRADRRPDNISMPR